MIPDLTDTTFILYSSLIPCNLEFFLCVTVYQDLGKKDRIGLITLRLAEEDKGSGLFHTTL